MWVPKVRIVKPSVFKGQSVGKDNFLLELFDQYGVKQDERRKSNTMYWGNKTTINLLQTTVSAMPAPSWLAVGTGVLAAPSAQATDKLTTEIAKVAMSTKTQTVNTSSTLSMSGTFGAGTGTGALIEAGIFCSVTANTVSTTAPMFAATSFAVMNKGALDVIVLNWSFSLS